MSLSCFSSLRWADDPVAQALVCFERRDLHVVQGEAGLSQVRLALQERRRNVYSVPEELEDALVCSSRLQTHVFRERQRGEAEGNH